MKLRYLPLIALATTAPVAAFAMPAVGDILGTSPTEATAALKAAGCDIVKFEAENRRIEAKCIETASGQLWEVYIDPKTGAATKVKLGD